VRDAAKNAASLPWSSSLMERSRLGRCLALLPAVSLALAAGACSPDASAPKLADNSQAAEKSTGAKVLTLAGLGDLRLGQALPKGGAWKERGVQISDTCRTVSSPSYPGVYAIVVDNRVQRITIGRRSTVQLAEGIGTG